MSAFLLFTFALFGEGQSDEMIAKSLHISIPTVERTRKQFSLNSKASKIQAQQVRTIYKQRVTGKVLGSLNEDKMVLIDAALKLHLGLV